MQRFEDQFGLESDQLDFCPCNRNQKALFYCKSEKCKSKQKFYCQKCSQEEDKHDHRTVLINKECDGLKALFELTQ